MVRPLPKNLEVVYGLIGPEAAKHLFGLPSFELDGVEFVSGYSPESTPDRFYIVKSPELLGMYRDFLDEHRPRRVFELGIAEGGSVAWLALQPGMERVVSIDNEEHRLEALDEFVARRGLADVVSTYYGVDQGDGAALSEIAERHFGSEGIDLVIDDASHDYGLTRASFVALFPHVRPGGWYLIEDWAQPIKTGTMVRDGVDAAGHPIPEPTGPEPLARLGFELAIAMCTAPELLDRVELNHEFVAVRRGPSPIEHERFPLDHLTRGDAVAGLLGPRRPSA